MNHSKPDLRSASFLIAASACWGIATVISKHILTTIPPITLLTIQLIFSVGLLWSLIYLGAFHFSWKFRGCFNSFEKHPIYFTGGHHLPKSLWMKVGWLGLLNPGISYTLSLIGLKTTTASMSTLLWASEPVLILILARWLLREKLTPRVFLFSLVAISGVILISGLDTKHGSNGSLPGNVLILGGVLCCAFYTVLTRRIGQDFDPLVAVALQQTFALIWAFSMLPFELTINHLVSLFQLDAGYWFWAASSGVLYYALAFWLYLTGLKQLNAVTAGAFINLIPIFGISSAYVLLGERLTIVQWIGAGAILLSVFAIWLWGDQGN